MGIARLFTSALVCLSTVLSLPSRAADLAACTGLVLDENGIPVAAAQLKLEDGSAHVYRTETDGAGRFTFRDLPTGDFKLEVRKQGFFVIAARAITFQPGANELNLTLNHAEELHEHVQVTAPANQIDPQDTAQRNTLTARAIRDIPVPSPMSSRRASQRCPKSRKTISTTFTSPAPAPEKPSTSSTASKSATP